MISSATSSMALMFSHEASAGRSEASIAFRWMPFDQKSCPPARTRTFVGRERACRMAASEALALRDRHRAVVEGEVQHAHVAMLLVAQLAPGGAALGRVHRVGDLGDAREGIAQHLGRRELEGGLAALADGLQVRDPHGAVARGAQDAAVAGGDDLAGRGAAQPAFLVRAEKAHGAAQDLVAQRPGCRPRSGSCAARWRCRPALQSMARSACRHRRPGTAARRDAQLGRRDGVLAAREALHGLGHRGHRGLGHLAPVQARLGRGPHGERAVRPDRARVHLAPRPAAPSRPTPSRPRGSPSRAPTARGRRERPGCTTRHGTRLPHALGDGALEERGDDEVGLRERQGLRPWSRRSRRSRWRPRGPGRPARRRGAAPGR